MKPLPWSFTGLEKFKNCPHAFHQIRVLKLVADPMGEAAIWGDRVHKKIEDFINTGEWDDEIKPFQAQIFRALLKVGGTSDVPGQQTLPEYKMALGSDIKPADWTAPNVWVRGIVDLLKINGTEAWALDWKGLPLDTEIPTPTGFTTMGGLREGDEVIGGDGKVCRVVGKSAVHNRPCYKVYFDDMTNVVCDNVHLWKLADGAVKGVTELKTATKQRAADAVLLTAPVQLPIADLPIDPYVLGIWLADGKHTSGEVSKPDDFIWEEIKRRGYSLGGNIGASTCPTRTVFGIRGKLNAMGVLGNKHIPSMYLRASYAQRLDLLRGLMDGDGNANPTRKQAVFTTCSKTLSDQVKELLVSLGERPNQSATTQRGFGLEVTAYPVAFRPQGANPFLLPRKADRILDSWGKGESWRRAVVRVDEIVSVPTQCIAVDSPDHTFLCTREFIPTHNTGKVKPDSRQLKLFALLVFYHFPQVTRVHTSFEWLAHNTQTEATFELVEVPELWKVFLDDLRQYKEAFQKDIWQKRSSGLCKAHCSVLSCNFNGRG